MMIVSVLVRVPIDMRPGDRDPPPHIAAARLLHRVIQESVHAMRTMRDHDVPPRWQTLELDEDSGIITIGSRAKRS